MKKFKDIIKCFYHWNSFKSPPWKGGRVCSRAPLMSMIFINRLKRWTESTESWSRSKKDVWSNWRDGVILSQREQWFKTQFFIKIIISESLKVWLLSSSDSPTMSHLVVIRDKIKQGAKLSLTITGLFCIMMLIVTSLTAWHANVLRLFDRGLWACCTPLKSFKNAGKTSSATSSQTCLSWKVWIWFLLLLIDSQKNDIISPAVQKTSDCHQRKLSDCSFMRCFVIMVCLSL